MLKTCFWISCPVQACRGSDLDDGTFIEADNVPEQTSERIPVEADFMYAYSTAPGKSQWQTEKLNFL